MNAITAPALRYYGGKYRLADWIISHFPAHVCYCEPYAGGASILLCKEPARHEVYNDLDGDVVNFFTVLRTQTSAFIQAIELTPFSRAELDNAYLPTDEPLERARRLYIRNWQGYGVLGRKAGWRFCKSGRASAVRQWNRTDHLMAIAKRLKNVQLECDEASVIINRFDAPTTLYYVDPPYVHSTRNDRNSDAYGHEMTDDQHRELAAQLHAVKGMVALSGYPSALYDELYAGWQCVKQETLDIVANVQTECLWLSPALVSALAKPRTLDMFASIEGQSA
jgi:DNA adenine methylase